MSSLAFWKKGDSKPVPPPPAHHFSPAPATGDVRTASNNKISPPIPKMSKSTAATPDVQSKFNELVDSAKKTESSTGKDITEITALADNAKKQPLRSPYSLSNSADELAKSAKAAANSFDPAAVKTKLGDDPSTAKAQADFNAAIASSSQAIKSTAATQSAAVNDFGQTVQNDFQLPANTSATKYDLSNLGNKRDVIKNDLAATMKKADQSALDAGGSLATAANNSIDKANKTLQPSFGGYSPSGSATGANANNSADLQKVQSEVALAQQQIAELKQQIAASKQQTASAAADFSNNTFGMAGRASNEPAIGVAQVKVASINENINSKFNAASNLLARDPSSFQSSTGNFSPLKPASNGEPGNALRTGTTFSGGGTDNGFRSSSGPSSTSPSYQQPDSGYPSTPHGGYASHASGGSSLVPNNGDFAVQPVGLQSPIKKPTTSAASNDFGGAFANSGLRPSTPSQTFNAATSNAQQSGWQSQNATANHVSEIDIPSSVLRGSGSYAPGSVNRLTPIQ